MDRIGADGRLHGVDGGDCISCLFCIHLCMFGVLVSITSIDCIQNYSVCPRTPRTRRLDVYHTLAHGVALVRI